MRLYRMSFGIMEMSLLILIVSSMTLLAQTVTDIDGNVYHTVTIGTQVWMVENLKTTKYRNGDVIKNITDNTAWYGSWYGSNAGAWCYYDNNSYNGTIYGKLYNWYAVDDSRKIAPSGWHVPTDAEWTTLTTYLGGVSIAGGKLKETGLTHWAGPNTGATNETGFTALPGGHREGYMHSIGYWWSATSVDNEYSQYAWSRNMDYDYSDVFRGKVFKTYGYSVRCVKDNSTGIDKLGNEIPTNFSSRQNYPNPFNPTTNISYELPKESNVLIKIYNVYGQEIRTLKNEKQPMGYYYITFDGTGLPSGVYFYKIEVGDFREVKKMVMLR